MKIGVRIPKDKIIYPANPIFTVPVTGVFMSTRIFLYLLVCLILFPGQWARAQDNQEPSRTAFQLEAGRRILLTPMEFDTTLNGFRTLFEFREPWRGKQVIVRLPPSGMPYDFLINGFRFGSDAGNMVPAAFNITPFVREGTNAVETRFDPTSGFMGYPRCPLCEKGSLEIRENLYARDLEITTYPGTLPGDVLVRTGVVLKSFLTGKCKPVKVLLLVNGPSGENLFRQERTLENPPSFGQETEMVFDQNISHPVSWSPANPALYSAEFHVSLPGPGHPEIISTTFGIRSPILADSIIITERDTIPLLTAPCYMADSLTMMTPGEVVERISTMEFNAIATGRPLPARLAQLLDRHGILVIRKEK